MEKQWIAQHCQRVSTHILEQGSDVGCHQQYSCALRCCQLPCHDSLSQVGRGDLCGGLYRYEVDKNKQAEANECLKKLVKTLEICHWSRGWGGLAGAYFSAVAVHLRGVCFAVEGPLAAVVWRAGSRDYFFTSRAIVKVSVFNPRRVLVGSGSFQRRVFAWLYAV